MRLIPRRALWPAACALVICRAAAAQGPVRPRSVDVISYGFQILLPDSGDTIRAQATLAFHRATDTLALDLVGLTVDSVGAHVAGSFARLAFAYDGSRLRIALPPGQRTQNVSVFYHGVPRDGLAIGASAAGHRAVFGDNWPERARYWLPTVDAPADKAEVLWLVGAPATWRVVANGRLARAGRSPDGRSWWAYEEHHPIPTYTMVLGASAMSVSRHPPVISGRDTVPIEVWTFPEDSAFADSVPFRRVTEVVATLQRLIGPFPYEKLAHVESSTRYGGMENSSAIFYAEPGYVRRTMREGVVRHETAHQWFGDAVTERDFHHLWLSEGFASYFDLVAGAALDGDSVLARGMARDAQSYMGSRDVDRPVVDTAVTEPVRLLNANSYQKGAWVLHMLRAEVGESAFWAGIRDYYRSYRDSSVLSAEFQATMERAVGRPLGWFFDQWLGQPGYPRLDVAWRFDAAGGAVVLDVAQAQPAAWGLFRLPAVPVTVVDGDRVLARGWIALSERRQSLRLSVPAAPTDVRVDPDRSLLLTAAVRRAP